MTEFRECRGEHRAAHLRTAPDRTPPILVFHRNFRLRYVWSLRHTELSHLKVAIFRVPTEPPAAITAGYDRAFLVSGILIAVSTVTVVLFLGKKTTATAVVAADTSRRTGREHA